MKQEPFGFERPEHSPGFMLWQTTIMWQRRIAKALEPHNISHPQFVIMAVLLWLQGHKEEVFQVDIIELTKLDKMTVSNSLRKLESLGYLTRKESRNDSRAKKVTLITKGKNLIKKLVPIVESTDAEFFDSLDTKDQSSLLKLLIQLTE